MQLWSALGRLWIALGLFAALAAGAAVIYKWTDADGVTHYSDQAVPGAEKIVTSSGSANGIGGGARAQTNAASTNAPPTGPAFSVFTIDAPAKEQVFFGDEIVPVRLSLQPGLRPNQTITWHLNGTQLNDQGPDATAFALQDLPRGTYTIAATVTDSGTGESRSTDSVTFYVRQPSELAPQHKKP
jgi:Domain of unknown function (DUF4124)